jgi:flagellar protein FlaJ
MLHLLLKLGDMIPQSILKDFAPLQKNLAKASIRMTFQTYVGLMAFASLVSGAATFLFALIIMSIPGFPLGQIIVISVIAGFFATLTAAGTCYIYPSFNASSRARKIDANLPLIANFMSVLASAGMPPERIVRSLANVGDEFSIGQEARRIIGDIELMGYDLKEALKNAALRSPSKKFATMLDGLVTTSHMGGDLGSYLREEADKFKKARLQSMRGFLGSLATLAEGYISFMIALPLALIVMLSVMSFIGGGAMMGGIDPATLLSLVTFVVTPAGVAVMLLMVDSVTPPR